MNRYARGGERVVNIALISVSLILGSLLVKRYFFDAGRASVGKTTISVGSVVKLPDADLTKSDRSLLLALSPACAYCSASAPFYQRITKVINEDSGTQLVALLTPGLEGEQDYLHSLGLSPSVVSYVPLDSLGFGGVPTLVLVDREGRVKDVWVGKLSEVTEYEVLGKLRKNNGRDVIQAEELKAMLDDKERHLILDIAERPAFAREHILSAKNIPADELKARARDELETLTPIVIYCGDGRAEQEQKNKRLVNYARQVLLEFGYKEVFILQGGPEDWRKAGLNTVTDSSLSGYAPTSKRSTSASGSPRTT